ncbi:MAG: tetratricopeptide repeat protein [Bacteroidales bacterium]|nr:tetratricopeptide repeat protein [Bacteroidales bacterium]
MKIKLLTVLFLLAGIAFGQKHQKDSLRAAGYEAMTEGEYDKAVNAYSKIIFLDSSDYDAHLALGRLYYKKNKCDSSILFFQRIYSKDSTDAEAMMGFTRCYIRKEKFDTAIYFAHMNIKNNPAYIPAYLLLAKALSYDGKVDKAIEVYKQANRKDDTWSQVWAGLGKMYYWKSMPYTAEEHYKKAIELDPENNSIKNEYETIRKILKLKLTGSFQYLQEKEESYQIDAFVQRYGISKRLSDHFQLSVNFLLDYSTREFVFDDDTTRWFDNTWIKAGWINEKNHFSIYAGGSNSDQKMSTYGASWRYKNKFGKLKIKNTIDGGYSYFYYWNEVGRHAVSNKLKISFFDFVTNVDVSAGIVDEKDVRTYTSDPYIKDVNPHINYRFAFKWQVLENPDLKIGGSHSYYDFKYISRDYYSPNDRFLTGPLVSVYYDIRNFYVYGMYSYNFGTEKYYYLETINPGNGANSEEVERSGTIDADNWSASFETGFNWDKFSLSAGISRFYNPYYENLLISLSISAKL